jgi:predicted secreted Zn-dependent protease
MGKILGVVFLVAVFTSAAAAGSDALPSVGSAGKNVRVPVVTERTEYYEVEGVCEKDLRCDLGKKGCKWDDGKVYDSETSWSWKWDCGRDAIHPDCSPDAVTVTVEIVFKYPKWVPIAAAPPSLVKKWDEYLKNLKVHENGHRDMAVAAATGFSRAVAALPPVKNCSELESKVHALGSEWMEKLNADSREYDLATKHGVKQGALFP